MKCTVPASFASLAFFDFPPLPVDFTFAIMENRTNVSIMLIQFGSSVTL